jgi:hypothetical protein
VFKGIKNHRIQLTYTEMNGARTYGNYNITLSAQNVLELESIPVTVNKDETRNDEFKRFRKQQFQSKTKSNFAISFGRNQEKLHRENVQSSHFH